MQPEEYEEESKREKQDIVETKKSGAKGNKQASREEVYVAVTDALTDEDCDVEKERMSEINGTFKSLNYSQVGLFKEVLALVFRKKQFSFQQSVLSFAALIKLFKDAQVVAPICEALFQFFSQEWERMAGPTEQLLRLWKLIPYQSLHDFLIRFNLKSQFCKQDPDAFLKQLSGSLFQRRIPQVCEYYRLYSESPHKDALELFLNSQLVPKLLQSDQIFTELVLKLLKTNPEIKKKILNHPGLDLSVGVRLVESIEDNIHEYPHLQRFIQHKHYRSIVHQHKIWYIIEDKISFSEVFIRFMIEDIKKENSDIALQGITNKDDLSMSLLQRNARPLMFPPFNYIGNPLDDLDDFVPSTILLNILNKFDEPPSDYLCLKDYQIHLKDVVIITQINHQFKHMDEALRQVDEVGFDTEFRCTVSKHEQQGIAIIQLATIKQCFIIDFLKLEGEPALIQFLIGLLQNEKIKKIGHTISSDLKFLSYTFKHELKVQSFVDLSHLFKQQWKGEKYSSLAFMSSKFLGKKMCKYQQRSNWNRRPLRQRQIHYAALDAYACLLIYQILIRDKQETPINAAFAKQPRQPHLKLKEKQDQLEKYKRQNKQPRFLVDNMLKKLCSMMRNCGLDAEYLGVKDYELAIAMANKEQRVILTRDSKFYDRRDNKAPIYLIAQKTDSECMFTEILQQFKVELSKYETLSRCVKCNGSELVVIEREQALRDIQFKHEDNTINKFWRCNKCRQIYWEGGQFQKAKAKYAQFRK